MRAIDLIKVESKDIKWLTDNLKSGVITVDNSYQRKYIWQQKDQVALIETILIGYPIPEIYLWANNTDPDTGDTKYSIVDGQQRLTTIQRYLNDEFKLSKAAIDDKEADYSGKIFSELSADNKRDFWRYQFSSRFINESLRYDEIAKLFLRLNRTNTTLNPQELRNAEFNGEFLRLAEEIAQNEFWDNYKIFTQSDIRRMQDIQFISTLLIFLRMGIEQDNTQKSINRVYDQYNENYPEATEDRIVFNEVLRIISQIINNKQVLESVVKKKGHLYFIFVLAYYYLQLSKSKLVDMNVISSKLEDFFNIYELNEQDNPHPLVEEYRFLSQEGSKKSHNRQRRFDILKEFCSLHD
ncbi:TPA: DUF262 domain-containing protein [Escherichia coli]|uniref:DUF262 domain-containing protein n=1 Tax=Escherichia coli TaxID=562 RepID=A0A2X6TMX5_ECOLX|nr:DUF262 domain-containing protein [Escherichia coli]DAJ10930.1 MAG TPA: Protein of unknown function DUF262 [Bacteriophage sp.]EFA8782711.1 DUF262 domain-containing protein [Escherichia coli]EFD4948462.1 DUF262 domain-containing protein [Escherichia coli]EFE8011871.1 DUF262 domain-containing protein [Escherichia coli]EFN9670823.1 DUF262 domain-containing protein [Escherichia coli]